jgi:diguanylate cyclase
VEQSGAIAANAPLADRVDGALGHPKLMLFDSVRALLVETGLPPEPEVYDLFWRYARNDDFQLVAAVDAARADAVFDMAVVKALRLAHCGDISASNVAQLVETARVQADSLSQKLRDNQADLATYGRAIAVGDAALNGPTAPATPDELQALIQPLGVATTVMIAANRRLESELEAAAAETAKLRDQLHRAENAAVTDALTGLLNRRGLIDALETAQAHSVANGALLSVAMVDIDHFKRVNDQWGHALGDEVLRFVGQHLAAGLGEGGVVGRLGGEEFVAVLPGQPIAVATATIDRLRGLLAGQIIRRTADGASMGRITFSAGVALSHAEDTADSVISRADGALYTAKRLGRDRVIPDRQTTAG